MLSRISTARNPFVLTSTEIDISVLYTSYRKKNLSSGLCMAQRVYHLPTPGSSSFAEVCSKFRSAAMIAGQAARGCKWRCAQCLVIAISAGGEGRKGFWLSSKVLKVGAFVGSLYIGRDGGSGLRAEKRPEDWKRNTSYVTCSWGIIITLKEVNCKEWTRVMSPAAVFKSRFGWMGAFATDGLGPDRERETASLGGRGPNPER